MVFSWPYFVRSRYCDRLASVVCRLSVTLCIVAKRCVLEQKLLLTVTVTWGSRIYEKSIGTKMNDLDLCLEVVSRTRQPLRYIWRWISRKPLEIEAWFQRTPIGNNIWLSNGHVTDDVTWHPKVLLNYTFLRNTVGYPSDSLASCLFFNKATANLFYLYTG